MANVVGIDTSKYNSTPIACSNDLFQDRLLRENVRCTLISESSKVDVLCTFVNGSLQMIEVLDNEGLPYVASSAVGAVRFTQNFLNNYQVQNRDSFYAELNSMLMNVDENHNSTATAGNLKLQVSASENDTTFRWTYTANGIEAPDKCVALRYQNGFLKYFVDNWNLYRIGSISVNLSEEEAIEIAITQTRNYTPYADSDDVSFRNLRYNVTGAMIFETVLSPSLYVDSAKAHSSDLLELYPLRHVWVSLDKFYPGNVYGFNVYIWADTKEICYFHERISTMDPPVELLTDWTAGSPPESQRLQDAMVEPNSLAFTVELCTFAVILLFLIKNRKSSTFASLGKLKFLNLGVLFLCILLSSSVWIGWSAQTVNAEPYNSRATVWGSESLNSWNSSIGSSWRKQFNNEVVWQRSTSQYIANLFQFNGYSSTNNQGTNNQTSNKDSILTQISSNEAGYPRVAVVDFDHGNGLIDTASAIPGAEIDEFHYIFEDNLGTVNGTWAGYFNYTLKNDHAVYDSNIYNKTTGKTFFALINACNSANINDTFGTSKLNFTSTQGLIDQGQSDERARGMPFAWTHRLVGTNSTYQPAGNMSADGYRYPDGNYNCYIGFDGGSAALQQAIAGTQWPYYYWVYHFFYWAVSQDYTIHQALDLASQDAFQGKDFDQTLLYNGTGFASLWPMCPNGTWETDSNFIGYMKVYGNANLKLYQPSLTLSDPGQVGTSFSIDSNQYGTGSVRVTPGPYYSHTIEVTVPAHYEFDHFHYNYGTGSTDIYYQPVQIYPSHDGSIAAYFRYGFTDDFNDNSIDTTKWDELEANGGTANENNTQLEVTIPSGTGQAQAGYVTKDPYNIQNEKATVEVAQLSNVDEMILQIGTTNVTGADPFYEQNWYRILKAKYDSKIYVQRKISGGAVSTMLATTWTAATGTLTIEVSNSAIAFYEGTTLRYSEPYALPSYNVYTYVFTSTLRERASGTDRFDNFALSPTTAFMDDFNDGDYNGWTASGFWSVNDGELVGGGGSIINTNQAFSQNRHIHANIKTNYAGYNQWDTSWVVAKYAGLWDNMVYGLIHKNGNVELSLYVNGQKTSWFNMSSLSVSSWHTVDISVVGTKATMWVDGVKYHSVTNVGFDDFSGSAALHMSGGGNALGKFDNTVVQDE